MKNEHKIEELKPRPRTRWNKGKIIVAKPPCGRATYGRYRQAADGR